jgi:ribosomal protein S18 acetylase RimI-like enzyme
VDRVAETVDVELCEQIGLARWFEIGRRPADLAKAVDALTALYRDPGERRPFHLVAVQPNGGILAKLGGYTTSTGRLAFWSVYYAESVDELRRRRLCRRLVRACLDRAIADPAVRFVETRPGHDSPDLPILRDAIRDEGMRLVAEHHVYQWSARTCVEERPSPVAGLRIAPCRHAERGLLAELFDRVQKATLDRVEREQLVAANDTLDELALSTGQAASTSLWSLAFLADTPVGYILCRSDRPDGLVLEVGVIPEARRRGIGSQLLHAALGKFTSHGVDTVEALIDDVNVPSIALHKARGFVMLPGEFYTWRYDATPPTGR